MSRPDAVLEAIYTAQERWDAAERTAHDLRQIAGKNGPKVERPRRTRDGSWIPAPRRSALARYLTDAALTAIRAYDEPATREWESEPDRPTIESLPR